MLKNWKTSLLGAAVIAAGVYVFVTTKDFTQTGIAITTGIALMAAKDGNVTGGTIKQQLYKN